MLLRCFLFWLTDTDALGVGLTAANSSAAWNMAGLDAALGGSAADRDSPAGKKKATTAEEFLGSNANLVNLNELVVRPPPSSEITTHTKDFSRIFTIFVAISIKF